MILRSLIKRNCKMYFKDKSVFFPSLITPMILLFLYVAFLKNVYVDTFNANIPTGFDIEDKLVNGFVGGWLISSLLAVCCITVSFSANTIMVSDKANGNYQDLSIAPIKKSTLSLSYYFSTAIVTGIICSIALVGGVIYLGIVGWYLSFFDVVCMVFDCILLVLFGTALSSIIFKSLKSVGGVSAICTIVSAGYGFVCGAYMPISQFGEGLQKILMCLPWTYGTGLVRTHSMRGVLSKLEDSGIPKEIIDSMSKGFDIKLFFFGNEINTLTMYLILGCSVAVLIGIFIAINVVKIKKSKNK